MNEPVTDADVLLALLNIQKDYDNNAKPREFVDVLRDSYNQNRHLGDVSDDFFTDIRYMAHYCLNDDGNVDLDEMVITAEQMG